MLTVLTLLIVLGYGCHCTVSVWMCRLCLIATLDSIMSMLPTPTTKGECMYVFLVSSAVLFSYTSGCLRCSYLVTLRCVYTYTSTTLSLYYMCTYYCTYNVLHTCANTGIYNLHVVVRANVGHIIVYRMCNLGF